MRTGSPDLDDVEELIAADVDGLLPAVALAGAQVRSVGEAQREGVLEPLGHLRPRSVVIVCGAAGAASPAAQLVIAVISTRIDVPIVYAPALPGWIGPLDVVVLAGDDAGDMVLADAAARAVRRRAEVVVAAPIEGPLRDALAGNGMDLSPRVPVDPRFRFVGFVAALLAVFTSLAAVRFTGQVPDMAELADALDEEAAANRPAGESFHNRAKLLAARLDGLQLVWVGDTAGTSVVAGQAAHTLVALAGVISAVAEIGDVVRMVRDWSERTGSTPTDSIFYDPQIDGPAPAGPPRVVVATTAGREWYVRRRLEGIGDLDVLTGDGDATGSDAAGSGPSVTPAREDLGGDSPGDLTRLLQLLLRIEMAAVYLRLIGTRA
ncbi:hypothetical protein [Gordonia rhizosphera]|uniref:Bifunctional glucose-6-phosphate/mannose-6-phosphate isomerase C-terminal domain-containing protein n=1 Tax=Gordonia rhizosphera NBRC 16068 TaxID=1108045 RepID=K6V4H3_9ACTN|nr:hypothetical protein [Gordonia rhizosphera]GAB91063.1 hypothetical protein GORHZ_123_00070 [Gordonia rhizosphera NBRC 16068]